MVTHTLQTLEHIGTTTRVLNVLFEECGMKELADRIECTDTIYEIFKKVRSGNYWSFFNYELLENIVNCFCGETSLVAELDQYISKFKVYCQRRVSEVPHGSLKSNGEHANQQSQTIFNVKMDKMFSIEETNLEMIKDIQYKLQTILNVEPLQLVDVEDGCIKLTFRYFKQTRLFPLSEAQRLGLTEIYVQWICCDKDKVLLKKTHSSVEDYTDPSCSICASPINPTITSSLSGTVYSHCGKYIVVCAN